MHLRPLSGVRSPSLTGWRRRPRRPTDELRSSPTQRLPVLGSFPNPKYRPCRECGASVACAEMDEHVCERERWLDYQLFGQREQIARFEEELTAYLGSAAGRFEQWYAARARRLRPQ